MTVPTDNPPQTLEGELRAGLMQGCQNTDVTSNHYFIVSPLEAEGGASSQCPSSAQKGLHRGQKCFLGFIWVKSHPKSETEYTFL